MRPMEIDMIWGNTDENRICFLRRTGIAYDRKKFQRTEWVTLEWNTDHWHNRYVAKRKWRLQIPSHFAVKQM